MTVSYTGGVFSVRDGEHDVADLTTAKGSAIATSDEVYIWTDSSKGILGVGSGEEISCDIYAGYETDGSTGSEGELKIYGGGKVTIPASGTFDINKDYGILSTSTTSSTNKAEIDANECSNDIDINGGFETEWLYLYNVKSGGIINIQNITGYGYFLEIKGKTNATYYINGIPGDNFHVPNAYLNLVVPGIYTESGEPDIDLSSDGDLAHLDKSHSTSFNLVGIPGRRSARVLPGVIGAKSIKLYIELGSTSYDEVLRNLAYIHSMELQVLIISRAYGTDKDYPINLMCRGRILQPYINDPEGINYDHIELAVIGDE